MPSKDQRENADEEGKNEGQVDLAAEDDVPARAVDAPPRLFGRLGKPAVRKIGLFVVLVAVYLVVALPFKVLSVIPGFTDVRPVEMLLPVFGIFFGAPGCFAFAVGNLIGDIMSDSLRWSSIAGFVANFACPYLMYLFWCKLRREPFSLRRGRAIARMAATIIACGFVMVLTITPAVALNYPDVNAMLFGATVFGNDVAFPLCFGIPLMILMQDELGFMPLSRRFAGPDGQDLVRPAP